MILYRWDKDMHSPILKIALWGKGSTEVGNREVTPQKNIIFNILQSKILTMSFKRTNARFENGIYIMEIQL